MWNISNSYLNVSKIRNKYTKSVTEQKPILLLNKLLIFTF